MAESWKSIADALATRLSHATAPDHNPPRPDCPFCEDALAYARYAAKRASVGRPVPDPFTGRGSVPIQDVPLSDAAYFGTRPNPT
jgi:hypothetical protein